MDEFLKLEDHGTANTCIHIKIEGIDLDVMYLICHLLQLLLLQKERHAYVKKYIKRQQSFACALKASHSSFRGSCSEECWWSHPSLCFLVSDRYKAYNDGFVSRCWTHSSNSVDCDWSSWPREYVTDKAIMFLGQQGHLHLTHIWYHARQLQDKWFTLCSQYNSSSKLGYLICF